MFEQCRSVGRGHYRQRAARATGVGGRCWTASIYGRSAQPGSAPVPGLRRLVGSSATNTRPASVLGSPTEVGQRPRRCRRRPPRRTSGRRLRSRSCAAVVAAATSAAARPSPTRMTFSVMTCRPGGGVRESTDAGDGRGRTSIAPATTAGERQNWWPATPEMEGNGRRRRIRAGMPVRRRHGSERAADTAASDVDGRWRARSGATRPSR